MSDRILWLLGDHQNTVRDVVDDNAVLRRHVDYDSFGDILNISWYGYSGGAIGPSSPQAVDQLFYFQGQERDAATGLQLHGARWYDPQIGRFLSEDPISFDGGDPNLYRYVGNSPTNFVDPTGLSQAGNPLNNLFGGYTSALGGLGSAIASTGTYQRAASIGNSIYNAGSNLLAASPGQINEFIGLTNNYSNLTSQIDAVQSLTPARGRYSNIVNNRRAVQLSLLTSERGVTYGNAANLLDSILFDAQRVDIGYNPGVSVPPTPLGHRQQRR